MLALPAEVDWTRWLRVAPYRIPHAHETPAHFQHLLAGATYCDRMNSLSMGEAMLYEMQLVAGLTLRDMFAFPSGANVVKVNIHRTDFAPDALWEDVLEVIKPHALSRHLALRELALLDKRNMSKWTAGQQAHVNPNPSAQSDWSAEHECLFQSLFPSEALPVD